MASSSWISWRDPLVFQAIELETKRQREHLELIASENYVSPAVLEAQGSLLTNKYAEGYPGKRYYGGCEYVDAVESLAQQRARQLFQAEYVNVQPHSGSNANLAVFLALLKPGDTILAMSLSHGGHLSHGAPVNLSGKWFQACYYGVNPHTGFLDYDEMADLAKSVKPRLIIAGYSSYPRQLDYRVFREIADQVGAYLMVDMAHFAGFVAAQLWPNPLEWADVVTSTTHKTLRGPRGGLILSNNPEVAKKLNSAVFPGLQGGPLMHVIAAKAVCFGEALSPRYRFYMQKVQENAQALAQTLMKKGLSLVTGGTDNHLLVVDLRALNLTGLEAQNCLEKAHMTVNKNAIAQDPLPPTITSGIRLGTPALTTRGLGVTEFETIGSWMAELLQKDPAQRLKAAEQLGQDVARWIASYPLFHPSWWDQGESN